MSHERCTRGADEVPRAPPPRLLYRRSSGYWTVQDQNPHIGTGVVRGHRLTVRPYAGGRVIRARVVLGDDGDSHGRRVPWVTSVSWAAALDRYGRVARNSRASSMAACGSYPLATLAASCRTASASAIPSRQPRSWATAAQARSRPQP